MPNKLDKSKMTKLELNGLKAKNLPRTKPKIRGLPRWWGLVNHSKTIRELELRVLLID